MVSYTFYGADYKPTRYSEIERLVVAGALDKRLQNLLVQDPSRAIDRYWADRFGLSVEEKAFICSIRATDFADLVSQVAHWVSQRRE